MHINLQTPVSTYLRGKCQIIIICPSTDYPAKNMFVVISERFLMKNLLCVENITPNMFIKRINIEGCTNIMFGKSSGSEKLSFSEESRVRESKNLFS